MKFYRFYLGIDLPKNILEIKDVSFIHQMHNVLKLKKGEAVIVFNGKGDEIKYEILEFSGNGAKLKFLEKIQNQNEPKVKIILYVSIPKKGNLELIAEKCTELGVCKIVPLVSDRTEKTGLKLERLRKIIKEAAEQSGRAILPEISEPITFKQALKECGDNDINFFFHTAAKEGIGDISKLSKAGIFIGPEGGWSDSEVAEAKNAGLKISNLGKLVLRVETAAIAASALIINKLTEND